MSQSKSNKRDWNDSLSHQELDFLIQAGLRKAPVLLTLSTQNTTIIVPYGTPVFGIQTTTLSAYSTSATVAIEGNLQEDDYLFTDKAIRDKVLECLLADMKESELFDKAVVGDTSEIEQPNKGFDWSFQDLIPGVKSKMPLGLVKVLLGDLEQVLKAAMTEATSAGPKK